MAAERPTPQQLIEQHQGLVHLLATRIAQKAPPSVDRDDLVSYGQVGLAEAARDFDPARGSQFSTYAYYRIRGAIFDGLSKLTGLGRAGYHQVRYQRMATDLLRLESEAVSEANERTLRDDACWFSNLARRLTVVYLVSRGAGEERRGTEWLADRSTPQPPDAAANHEVCQRLRELIDALPEQARTLIQATYFEGLTLEEAGRRLGVSKSWASRLHARTLHRLAGALSRAGVAP